MTGLDVADELTMVRQFYAEEVAAVAGVVSPAIIKAFATVPRERFLGPGPWQLCSADSALTQFKYRPTPNGHPRHIHHNVPVAIDQTRILNNGQPSLLATWMEWLEIQPGERIVHIGCGTGYFSAILSEITGPAGSVLAIEVDPSIAARARENLSAYSTVSVVEGDATALNGPVEVILVNAGATHAQPVWLDALGDGGRLLLPLTFDAAPDMPGKGAVLKVTRRGDRFAATFGPMVVIYPCAGTRDSAMSVALQRGFMHWTHGQIKSVRRDSHAVADTCWAHRDGFCLSTTEP
jgi:protein-L-isoaspartate(D-aspartate) O-methyltransferase